MQAKQLEQYIALLDAHNLTHLEFAQGETRVVLERQPQPQFMQQSTAVMPETTQPQLSATTTDEAANKHGQTGVSPQENTDFAAHLCVVKAPLVGSAYKSRAPGEKPFVSVGSKVSQGDVLCLLEAMKHYNEIAAPCSGSVTQILFEDGQLAEFNLPLFVIEPEN